MSKNMALTYNEQKALWEFASGTKIVCFTANELAFIYHAVERNGWKSEIEEEIDVSEENLVFDNISREEFVGLCIDELESKWENMTLDNDPDYEGVVFDVANENGVWRY